MELLNGSTVRMRKEFADIDELIEFQAAKEGRAVVSTGPTTKIQYLIGDATDPIVVGTSERFIVHVCNDVGAWGAGFTRSLSLLSPKPEQSYRDAIKQTKPHSLGAASLVKVNGETGIFVANMIAQHGLPSRARRVVIDYLALEKCLGFVTRLAVDWRASAHMPRIGCGIAGGDWRIVEAIIERTLCAAGVKVFVYDLPRSLTDN